MEIGRERHGMGFVRLSHIKLSDHVSLRVKDDDVVAASDENVVRRGIDGEVVPSALTAENDFLEQVILRNAGILRPASGRNCEGCHDHYGEQA
jgi:hypothetical protein